MARPLGLAEIDLGRPDLELGADYLGVGPIFASFACVKASSKMSI